MDGQGRPFCGEGPVETRGEGAPGRGVAGVWWGRPWDSPVPGRWEGPRGGPWRLERNERREREEVRAGGDGVGQAVQGPGARRARLSPGGTRDPPGRRAEQGRAPLAAHTRPLAASGRTGRGWRRETGRRGRRRSGRAGGGWGGMVEKEDRRGRWENGGDGGGKWKGLMGWTWEQQLGLGWGGVGVMMAPWWAWIAGPDLGRGRRGGKKWAGPGKCFFHVLSNEIELICGKCKYIKFSELF